MTKSTSRAGRRERRTTQLAARRAASRAPVRRRSRIGIVQITAVAVVVGLGLIAAMIVLGGRPQSPPVELIRAAAPIGVPATGLVLGRAESPVTIDIYEDFQCPGCLHWGRDVFPSLARNELADGTARLVFHPYAFLGPESVEAAKAAWAADRQGRFWDMWATLYANQGLQENSGAFARERLVAMADLIGLDRTEFLADVDSPAATKAVTDARAAAVAAGIESTPMVVIDGRLLPGAGYADLKSAIVAAAG